MALAAMKNCVLSSVRLNDNEALSYQPFLLAKDSIEQPTFFEIVFIAEKRTFRYGFEYNQSEIRNEWLFEVKKTKENPLFIRTIEGIGVSDAFPEGKGKESATNNNRLFISLVAQLGGKTAKQILQWFSDYKVLTGIDNEPTFTNINVYDNDYMNLTLKMFHEKLDGHDVAIQFFKDLKLGFFNIEIIDDSKWLNRFSSIGVSSDILKKITGTNSLSVNTIHNKYDKNGNIIDSVSWDNEIYESEGTKKIISFSGPIFDTLKNGKVLVIDELDSKLHPLITMQIIRLFNNPKTNPNNAQLIFATHDTNLLSTDIFRRDQIWFTEKDNREQTDLYSLDDFVFADGTKVRKDANLEKNYIAGRYGAIPYITNTLEIFNDGKNAEN
jgi:AAA15 family ATPase/GTPase